MSLDLFTMFIKVATNLQITLVQSIAPMAQLTEYEQKSLHKFEETICEGKWSNEGLVQLIELVGDYLNPVSIQEYADKTGKSYNGIKKTKKATVLFGHKYIIDNE